MSMRVKLGKKMKWFYSLSHVQYCTSWLTAVFISSLVHPRRKLYTMLCIEGRGGAEEELDEDEMGRTGGLDERDGDKSEFSSSISTLLGCFEGNLCLS